jgi:hypothetical protein
VEFYLLSKEIKMKMTTRMTKEKMRLRIHPSNLLSKTILVMKLMTSENWSSRWLESANDVSYVISSKLSGWIIFAMCWFTNFQCSVDIFASKCTRILGGTVQIRIIRSHTVCETVVRFLIPVPPGSARSVISSDCIPAAPCSTVSHTHLAFVCSNLVYSPDYKISDTDTCNKLRCRTSTIYICI